VYGDIAYASAWCGFFDPGVTSGAYFDWREQHKVYMTGRNLDPSHLTNAQVEAITVFAGALPPIKTRVTYS